MKTKTEIGKERNVTEEVKIKASRLFDKISKLKDMQNREFYDTDNQPGSDNGCRSDYCS